MRENLVGSRWVSFPSTALIGQLTPKPRQAGFWRSRESGLTPVTSFQAARRQPLPWLFLCSIVPWEHGFPGSVARGWESGSPGPKPAKGHPQATSHRLLPGLRLRPAQAQPCPPHSARPPKAPRSHHPTPIYHITAAVVRVLVSLPFFFLLLCSYRWDSHITLARPLRSVLYSRSVVSWRSAVSNSDPSYPFYFIFSNLRYSSCLTLFLIRPFFISLLGFSLLS